MATESVSEIKEKYRILNEEGEYYYENILELAPRTFNSKLLKPTSSGYTISKGKAPIFKRAVLLFFMAIALVIISMYFFSGEGDEWSDPIVVLPRILAIVLVVMGFLRLKGMKEIQPYMTFTEEGISKEDEIVSWESIVAGYLKTSPVDGKYYQLLIHTDAGVKTISMSKIDEIPEDACIILTKYWEKYANNE